MPHILTDLAGLQVRTDDFLETVLDTAAQPLWVVDPGGVIRLARARCVGSRRWWPAGRRRLRCSRRSLPPAIEATAYFVIAESLTNVAKHARASGVTVAARVDDGALRISVQDDGIGGDQPDGPGLLGLADRLAVLGGRLLVETPIHGGTLVAADVPLPG